MTRLPDSPLDEPVPPPLDIRLSTRWSWTKIGVAVLVMILFLGIIAPVFIRKRPRDRGQREVISNARQIGMALYEFEAEYGKFPDSTTVAAVRSKTGSMLPLETKSSNDFFRQLMASGIAKSESMFYAKGQGTHKSDGLVDGNHAIGKGECGYSYLSGLSSEGNPSRPIVVTPLIPGTNRFDPKPFEGKAVILKMDNSVTSLPIDKEGHVFIAGKNLFDPLNPIWEGKPPVIAWPDL